MYGHEETSREMLIEEYQADIEKILRYLPWLVKKSGNDVRSFYEGEEGKKVMPIPVFDSTLLSFVKDIGNTKLISKNYPYVYTKYRIKDHSDQLRLMKNARIQEIDLIKAILSKYVLGGRTKASMWTEAVDERIFATALECLNELFFTNTPDGKRMLRF